MTIRVLMVGKDNKVMAKMAADMGTDDHAAAGDPFNRNKTKSLHASRQDRHHPMSRDKSSKFGTALNPSESHLLFKRELPDSRHNSRAFWPVTHDRQSWSEACLAEFP